MKIRAKTRTSAKVKHSKEYEQFIKSKSQIGTYDGFDPVWMPSFLFGFQQHLVDWALRKGKSAIFADCGLGKTPMQLVWAENVVRKTGKRVLILTPLAVSAQTVREGAKFGIEVHRTNDGTVHSGINVTNYERLHYFDRSQFVGCVCDESSILKNFDGATRQAITEFMAKMPHRLLCTATAAPNDYVELGTSSEALGHLGFMDMLGRFFKKVGPTTSRSDEFRSGTYRFRGHAERDFWRWVCSWARAVRQPSDLGFDNNGFVLPELVTVEHIVTAKTRRDGWLFDLAATNLHEQREERRRTINERCEQAADLVSRNTGASVSWCHLNDEGHLLEKLIPGAVEVDGADSDEFKEETFEAFAKGQIQRLVSKPVIAGFGLNWQHCAHQTFFPSHSFEQWYQAIRRSWRFGQKNTVRVDMISSEGEAGVLINLNRKSEQADDMFRNLVRLMNNELQIERSATATETISIPNWL